MGSSSQDLKIRYVGDASSLKRTLSSIESAHASWGSRLASIGKTVGKGLLVVGAAAATGLGIGVKIAAEFDTSLRTMQAVAGVTGHQLDALGDLAIEQGKKTVFSANESAQAMLELSKAGISVADIQGGALQQTLALATAGNLDLASAATIAANAMNVFGLSGDQAQQAADALAGAANASSADVDGIAQSLAQAGNVAASAGMSIQQTTGVLAAFADAGIKGSDAGTSLKTFLLSLVPTSSAAKEAIKKLGLEFVDAQGNIRPITEIAAELQGKLGGLTQAEQQTALKTIFGTDAFRAANIVMGEGAAGLEDYIAQTSEAGTATEVGAKRMSGFAGAMESLKGSLETVALTAGQALLPVLAKLAEQLVPVVNVLGKVLANVGKALAPILAALGKAIGEVLEALGPALGKVLKALAPVLGELAEALAEILIALVPLLPPLADLIAALAPLIPLIARLVAAVVRLLVPALNAIIKVVTEVVKWIVNLVLHWHDGWEAIRTVAGAVLGALGRAIGTFIRNVQQVWSTGWNAVRTVGTTIWNGLKAAASTAWSAIETVIIDPIRTVKDVVITVFQTIRDTLRGIWNGLKAVASTVWNAIAGAVRTAVNLAIDAINVLIRGMNKVSGGLDWIAGPFANWGEIPEIPHLARGGTMTRAGLALVGEQGPEVLALPRGASVIPTSSRGGLGTLRLRAEIRVDRRRFGRQQELEVSTAGWW